MSEDTAALHNALRAQLDAKILPNTRDLLRFDPDDLDKLISNIGDPDWSSETKVATRQMGVSDAGKARLLAISRRTGLSPTRALDTAITKLYNATIDLALPSQDEIAASLAAGRTPAVQLPDDDHDA